MEITLSNFDSVFGAMGRFHMAKRQADAANKRFDSATDGIADIRRKIGHSILTDDDLLNAGKLVARKRRADAENYKANATMAAIRDALTNP